ncbi:hypothetical protein N9A79_01485 [Pirellulales bacterium]|nr:hypothetical protein [Pirellulales bacterium]
MSFCVDGDERVPVCILAQSTVRCPHGSIPGLRVDVIRVNDWTALTVLVRSENDALLQHGVGSNVVVIKGLVRLPVPLNGGKSSLDDRPGGLFLGPMTQKSDKGK